MAIGENTEDIALLENVAELVIGDLEALGSKTTDNMMAISDANTALFDGSTPAESSDALQEDGFSTEFGIISGLTNKILIKF